MNAARVRPFFKRSAIGVASGVLLLIASGSVYGTAAAPTVPNVLSLPPACASQHEPHKFFPTNTHPQKQILESYYFVIDHLDGSMVAVCDLFRNVRAGDTITVYFRLTLQAAGDKNTRLALVSYTATAGTTLQHLFSCALFLNGDPRSANDCQGNTVQGNPSNPAANQDQQLTITIPNCSGFQVDFVYGEAHAQKPSEEIGGHIHAGYYGAHHRWISGMAGNRKAQACLSAATAQVGLTSQDTAAAAGTTPTTTGSNDDRAGLRTLRLHLYGLPHLPRVHH
jgi:hypothetical protein